MDEYNEKLIRAIKHYQSSLDKYMERGNESKVLYCLERLARLPIKVTHLEQTGVGRTVNILRKTEGRIGETAKSVIVKWKRMVLDEEDMLEEDEEGAQQQDQENSDQRSSHRNQNDETTEHEHKSNNCTNDNHDNSNSDTDSCDKSKERKKAKRRRHSSHRNSEKEDDTYSSRKSNSRKSSRTDENDDKKKSKHHHTKHKNNGKSKIKVEEVHSKRSSKISESVSHSDDDNNGEQQQVNSIKHKYKNKHKDRKVDDSTSSSRKHKNVAKSSDEPPVKIKHSKSKEQHNNDAKERHSKPELSTVKTKVDKEQHKKELQHKNKSSIEKDKHKHHNKPILSSAKHADSSKQRKKNKNVTESGITSGFGTSFAEALGMCGPSTSFKSQKSTDTNPDKNIGIPDVKDSISSKPVAVTPNEIEDDSNNGVNISSFLPPITPNYKPLGNLYTLDALSQKSESDSVNLNSIMTSKSQRTRVYSGNKVNYGRIPSLFELCLRVLEDHLESLEYTGGVPYEILKPILEKTTPNQLFVMEHHNPYLVEDTDELWRLHCNKDFKGKQRDEMETWREMYMRCLDEREEKLKALTANIKQSQDKSLPLRTTKLAYVDHMAKPPRNIARAQLKNGTTAMTPSAKLSSIMSNSQHVNNIVVPNPGIRAIPAHTKPKRAPLMAKSLSLLKNRFRR